MSLIEIPDPPGYKVVGYGKPKKGQPYLTYDNSIVIANSDFEYYCHALLEEVAVWRPVTIADIPRFPLACRVNGKSGMWLNGDVCGWRCENTTTWLVCGLWWNYCEIQDKESQS